MKYLIITVGLYIELYIKLCVTMMSVVRIWLLYVFIENLKFLSIIKKYVNKFYYILSIV